MMASFITSLAHSRHVFEIPVIIMSSSDLSTNGPGAGSSVTRHCPEYMTVGSGLISESAHHRLQALLDQDLGIWG